MAMMVVVVVFCIVRARVYVEATSARARWRRQSIFISYGVLSVCLTLLLLLLLFLGGRAALFSPLFFLFSFFLFYREPCKIRRNKLLRKFQPVSGWRIRGGKRCEARRILERLHACLFLFFLFLGRYGRKILTIEVKSDNYFGNLLFEAYDDS